MQETSRQDKYMSNAYNIYVNKRAPFNNDSAGQKMVHEGETFWLWAKVQRDGGASTARVFEGSGGQVGTTEQFPSYIGNGYGSVKWKYQTLESKGVALCLPESPYLLSGEKIVRHKFQVANNVDPILSILMMYSHLLTADEVFHAAAGN